MRELQGKIFGGKVALFARRLKCKDMMKGPLWHSLFRHKGPFIIYGNPGAHVTLLFGRNICP